MRREVIDDDDIALERWHETLFDIREVVFQIRTAHGRRADRRGVISFFCRFSSRSSRSSLVLRWSWSIGVVGGRGGVFYSSGGRSSSSSSSRI